jgi:tRNA-specific 2-thiouridylase
MPKKKLPKVFVALSGGVDSAVAAAILKEKGYQVSGVFMNLIPKKKGFLKARKNFQKAEKNAKKIARFLKISFSVLDLSAEFEKQVINSFLSEFKKGRTPNPCVICNQKIRFDIFLKKMRKKGADLVATGHYIKKLKVESSTRPNFAKQKLWRARKSKVNYKLFQARDKEKDQSYFLYNLKQNQLKRVLFPLGNLTKKEVRKLAKKFNLPAQAQPESQEICFVADKNISNFLSRHLKTKPGDIITVDGKKIGEHQGLIFYTIGQRREIGIGGTGPYYVIEKDIKNNNLIVSSNPNDPLLYKKELIAKKVNWISGIEPKLPLKIKVKTRYRQKMAIAVLIQNLKLSAYGGSAEGGKTKNQYKVKFETPQRAITHGQSVVFYLSNNELLGGGIIA